MTDPNKYIVFRFEDSLHAIKDTEDLRNNYPVLDKITTIEVEANSENEALDIVTGVAVNHLLDKLEN